MRLVILAALIAAQPWSVLAAPTWQLVSSEQGKRIELDRTSIKREDGSKVQATARVLLERDLPDAKTGGNYRIIEATTRYDCNTRNAATIRRVYKKNENETLREEEQKAMDLPVRTGTLDDKVLREVCRPTKPDAKEIVQKAGEAGKQLKAANDALINAELAKADSHRRAVPQRASVPAEHPAEAPVRTAYAQPYRQRPAPAVVEHAHIHWSYEGEGGPSNWHRLDPKNALCATGQRQSPIDIRDGIRVDLEPIRFNYRPGTFRIVDNGHTVQVTPLEGGTISLTGRTYELVQFHFHRPSEEKIDGRGFDMVVHLVHRSRDNRLAVVAVLLEKGMENAFIQTLWNNLPLEKNMDVWPPEATIDINAFLPESRNYYTYMGSLTTPPCSEDVLWLVMQQPVQVSQEQIAIFSRLYRNNARPVQPLAGRMIKQSR